MYILSRGAVSARVLQVSRPFLLKLEPAVWVAHPGSLVCSPRQMSVFTPHSVRGVPYFLLKLDAAVRVAALGRLLATLSYGRRPP